MLKNVAYVSAIILLVLFLFAIPSIQRSSYDEGYQAGISHATDEYENYLDEVKDSLYGDGYDDGYGDGLAVAYTRIADFLSVSDSDGTVWVTEYGTHYHKEDCFQLSGHEIRNVSFGYVISHGYTPCESCYN